MPFHGFCWPGRVTFMPIALCMASPSVCHALVTPSGCSCPESASSLLGG